MFLIFSFPKLIFNFFFFLFSSSVSFRGFLQYGGVVHVAGSGSVAFTSCSIIGNSAGLVSSSFTFPHKYPLDSLHAKSALTSHFFSFFF